jgi:glucose-6-phosphate isomerase
VVSKSGDTVETIAGWAIIWQQMLTKSGLSVEEAKNHVVITTNPEKGALAAFARSEGFTILPLPQPIHGRFSVFSPMGLMTAAAAGINIGELLAGARAGDQATAELPFTRNPAQQLAALHYFGLKSQGISNLILFPYAYRLRTIADWYSQLVAESLGKQGQGITPVKALGVLDQHSQLQLYNDGPKNKLVIFFSVKDFQEKILIPDSIAANVDYAYLANKSLNDMLKAEMKATEVSLFEHGVPSCRFELGELNAFNVGYLLTVLEKTVCILGQLLKVNAFDQPGVEESKAYARAMLGKSGDSFDLLRKTIKKYS